MGRKKHSIDVLFMFVLFALFAVLSVLLIFIGSGVYDMIEENKAANEQTRTTLSYITNKVRETSGAGHVALKNIQGEQVLTLTSDYDGYSLDTLIYEYDGSLMEMTVDSGDEFELKFGDVLLNTGGVEFELLKDKGILKVKVSDKNGRENQLSIYLGEE